ncbi:MAG TPA: cytochrome c peroxidase [Polyangiaceae bacterium]|nr:cytochrome c peroxidase [Polyangiaceae bacterium]
MSTKGLAALCTVAALIACSSDPNAAGGAGANSVGGASPGASGASSNASGASSEAGGGHVQTCSEAGLSAARCAELAGIKQLSSLPVSHGNEKADDFDAAIFGFHVFFDARFSQNLAVRCESCHSVDSAFTINEAIPTKGLAAGDRNSPTIFNAARYDNFLWDGRADSLWSQPLFAFENPAEMGFSRLELAHLLVTLYKKEYEPVFGPLPDISDSARFPAKGAPGDAAFDRMSADDQHTINGIAANVGKALEAYMRKVVTGPSPVDDFLAGNETALNAKQVHGMYVFAGAGCLDCHSGPSLSDSAFHNLGVPAAPGQEPDRGRALGVALLKDSPFSASGAFYDGPAPAPSDMTPVLGAFRTPSLRNLPKSAPYGHNGAFPTLEAVVEFHLQGGGKGQSGFVGDVDPKLVPTTLSSEDRAALIEFLKALTGKYPELPWGQWPNGNG